jgi:virginiamycin A acetyltransferase
MANPLSVLQKLGLYSESLVMRENSRYSKYSIGRFSYGQPTVFHWGEKATLKIGNFCSIGPNVVILLGGEHRPDLITTFPFNCVLKEYANVPGHPTTKGDVVIGNDVWIGANALILSGVQIGDGAVIGACAVVTKDVEPYAIMAGNPARIIGKRFDQETISSLLRIKWWNWEIQQIKENVPLLLSNRAREFVEKYDSLG